MFTIDLILKYTPMPLSVQRKDEQEAYNLYQQLREAMQSGEPQVFELTCDRQTDKKLSIATSELSAIQVSQKSGAAAAGRPPGFFSVSETQS